MDNEMVTKANHIIYDNVDESLKRVMLKEVYAAFLKNDPNGARKFIEQEFKIKL